MRMSAAVSPGSQQLVMSTPGYPAAASLPVHTRGCFESPQRRLAVQAGGAPGSAQHISDCGPCAGDHPPGERAAPAPGHNCVGVLALAVSLAPGRTAAHADALCSRAPSNWFLSPAHLLILAPVKNFCQSHSVSCLCHAFMCRGPSARCAPNARPRIETCCGRLLPGKPVCCTAQRRRRVAQQQHMQRILCKKTERLAPAMCQLIKASYLGGRAEEAEGGARSALGLLPGPAAARHAAARPARAPGFCVLVRRGRPREEKRCWACCSLPVRLCADVL